MNDRLEIASRLMAAGESRGCGMTDRHAMQLADALIAEEARTRPPTTDAPAPDATSALRQLEGAASAYAEFHGGCQHHPDECPGTDEECVIVRNISKAFDAAKQALAASHRRVNAPTPADLRAVAEAVTRALDRALWYGDYDHSDHAREVSAACHTALTRARAIGLGGGK